MSDRPRILVIKLGALGDFILSYRAMAAIRAHHRDAHLTLMTIASLEGFARRMGLFDEIWIDMRPGLSKPLAWWRLARRLNGAHFERVYDLQTANRTKRYFRLMRPPFTHRPPQWCGHVHGCAFPHDNPRRDFMHTLERQAEQLANAGIAVSEYPPLDLSWAEVDVARFRLTEDGAPYVLLVPGGSAGHPEKRWPAARYGELAERLISVGYRPVVLGADAERDVCAEVAASAPEVVNLCGATSLFEIMSLALGAAGAVGNDTGPMHLIGATGCPSLGLFSGASDPALARPRGPYEGPGALTPPPGVSAHTVVTLRRQELAALTVDEVRTAMLLREQETGAGAAVIASPPSP